MLDEEIELEPEIATQVMIDMSDPRSQHFGQMRHETLPADHLFGRRVEMLTLAVLSQLRARATSTGSRASGCTATRRSPSWGGRRPPSTARERLAARLAGSRRRSAPRSRSCERGRLSAERVRGWVEDAGVWAPLAFVPSRRR